MTKDLSTPLHGEQRRALLQIYLAALEAVAGDRVVRDWLQQHPQPGELAVIAIGKAAEQMTDGAIGALGRQVADALVITRQTTGLLGHRRSIQVMASDHPVPGAASLAAGERLLRFIADQPKQRRLLFLISGGASSLVEVPAPGVTLDLLVRCNRWLLGSGLPIDRINAVRQRLSGIKGGKLLSHLQGRAAEVLLISDVQSDDPAFIGSGLLFPRSDPGELPTLPGWLEKRLPPPVEMQAAVPPHHLVANLAMALEAAATKGRELGLKVHLSRDYLSGDAREQGEAFARFLLRAEPGIYMRGGETTVELPPDPGRGGRNQHLALAAARVIEGQDGLLVLAAGTDGSDGCTSDAGALVDGGTVARAALHGLDAEASLRAADAGTLLQATGDLVNTGPTGTNVTDLLIGWKFPG